MADTKSSVKVGGAYKESDDHVPSPTDLYDQYNTSGTGSHHVIEDVSPVFEVAKRDAKIQTGRALDPEDTDVPTSAVVLPDGQRLIVEDHDEIRDRLKADAEKAADNPVEVGGPSPSARLAALGGEEGESAAEAETANQGTQGAGATGDSAAREASGTGGDTKADDRPGAKQTQPQKDKEGK